jgi:hypothetical protein
MKQMGIEPDDHDMAVNEEDEYAKILKDMGLHNKKVKDLDNFDGLVEEDEEMDDEALIEGLMKTEAL